MFPKKCIFSNLCPPWGSTRGTEFLKEKMFGHLRHFYADRLKNLSFIFYPILIFIILAIYPIIFFLNLKNNNSDQNVMTNIDPGSLF